MKSIFLSHKQLFENPLPLFRAAGTAARASDLVLVTIPDDGFTLSGDRVNWFLSGGDCADRFGRDHKSSICAVRPALLMEPGDEKLLRQIRESGGVVTAELGTFPMTILESSMREMAEKQYRDGTLKKTGTSYTVAGEKKDVFRLAAKLIIRIAVTEETPGGYVQLSDGSAVAAGDEIFLEVRPVRWYYDEINKLLISGRALFAGLGFEDAAAYLDDRFVGELLAEDDIALASGTGFYSSDTGISSADTGITSAGQGISSSDHRTSSSGQGISSEGTEISSAGQGISSSGTGISSEGTEISSAGTGISSEGTEISSSVTGISSAGRGTSFHIGKHDELDLIRSFIEADIPVFIHGLTGDGKSDRVKEIDPDVLDIELVNETPETINGRAVYNESTDTIIDIKPVWLVKLERLCEDGKPHILFFDELTNATKQTQAVIFKIVLERFVNNRWPLPENARIVAAGNDRGESSVAHDLAEPLFGRFAHIYIRTTVENWMPWAVRKNINPYVMEFLANNDLYLRTAFTGTEGYADPRRWEMVSRVLDSSGNDFSLLEPIVGHETAEAFIRFFRAQEELSDIAKYTDEELARMSVARKYQIAQQCLYAYAAKPEEAGDLVKRLGAEFEAWFRFVLDRKHTH